MSTPIAAGTMALVREYFLEGFYRKTPFSPSSALLKAIAASSGHPLGGTVRTQASSTVVEVAKPPSVLQGFG